MANVRVDGANQTVIVGDGSAADSLVKFDGNAQDYHIGLDDSSDDLVIGLGSTLGTTSHIVIDEAGHVKMPLTCAFKAESNTDQSNVTGDGTSHTYLFQNETFDQNGDFSSPTFTAPVTGRYLFYWSTSISGIGSGHNTLEQLTTSNNNYLNHHSAVNMGRGASLIQNHSVIADMDASDTASVSIAVEGGSATVDTNYVYSYFAGVLLC